MTAGAQWSIDGGSWNNSGTVVSGLSVAKHTVRFKSMLGWSIPAPVSILVYPNTTTTRSVKYYQVTPGTLSINITPAGAVSAGAKWRVDLGAWHNSGDTVQLASGSHVITYAQTTGWIKPAGRACIITSGRAQSLTAIYFPSRVASWFPETVQVPRLQPERNLPAAGAVVLWFPEAVQVPLENDDESAQ